MTLASVDTRFHTVYLLRSGDPAFADGWYIGYTTNPLRRLRQHNGELVNGAKRTKRRGRPWTLVCFVDGFSEDQVALKFEYCWTYPQRSKVLRDKVFRLGSLTRFTEKVGVLHLLLEIPVFKAMSLTINVLNKELFEAPLPKVYAKGIERLGVGHRTTTQVRYTTLESVAELLAARGLGPSAEGEQTACEDLAQECLRGELGLIVCVFCGVPVLLQRAVVCPGRHGTCPVRAHLACMALWFVKDCAEPPLVPMTPAGCPVCEEQLEWSSLTKGVKERLLLMDQYRSRSQCDAFEAEKRKYMEETGLARKRNRRDGQPSHHSQRSPILMPEVPSGGDIASAGSSQATADAGGGDDEEWLGW